METAMAGLENPHVAVVPFPALSHYIPLLELSTLVASQGLTVTYVTIPANVPRLREFVDEAVSSGVDLRLLVLPTPPVEGLPEGMESMDVCPPGSHGGVFELAKKLQLPFNDWMEPLFQQHELAAPPVCIVFDSFMEWAIQSAEKFEISCVEFNPCGALGVNGSNSVVRSVSKRRLEKEGGESECVVLRLDLPRPLRFKKNEINEDYWRDEIDSSTMIYLSMCQIDRKRSSGLILSRTWNLSISIISEMSRENQCGPSDLSFPRVISTELVSSTRWS